MTVIEAEMKRLNSKLRFIPREDGPVSEVPIRIHSRDVDAGGAPEWHPAFERYLVDSGACGCERIDQAGNPHIDAEGNLVHAEFCSRSGRAARFHKTRNRNHPRRLQRALRQLRAISPAAYGVVWLILGRGQSIDQARTVIDTKRHERGENPYTDAEFTVLLISGIDLLTASY